MGFIDTGLVQNLLNDGELPKLEVETFIADDTMIKLGLIILGLIVVTILMLRLTV